MDAPAPGPDPFSPATLGPLTLKNRFVKAATMLTNGADEFRSQLGKARGSIARAHAAGAESDQAEPSPPLTVVG